MGHGFNSKLLVFTRNFSPNQPKNWFLTPFNTITHGYSMASYTVIQCEAPKIANLIYNSNNYGLLYL